MHEVVATPHVAGSNGQPSSSRYEMNKVISFLQLNFLPRSVDLGLLVLRLGVGLSFFWLHGLGKAMKFSELLQKFPDPLGIGHPASATLATFAEAVCTLLLAIGLFTRFAALNIAITMAVAFFIVKKAALTGADNGELPYLYLLAVLPLLIAGGGRFSLDAMLNRSTSTRADYR